MKLPQYFISYLFYINRVNVNCTDSTALSSTMSFLILTVKLALLISKLSLLHINLTTTKKWHCFRFMNIYTTMGDILGPCYFCSIYFCVAVLCWFIMESQMEETQLSWHILNTLKLISVFFSIKIFNSCEFHTVHILQEKCMRTDPKGVKYKKRKVSVSVIHIIFSVYY